MNSDDGILALVYEAGNEFFIVYTSDEAMELCNEPFSEFSPVSILLRVCLICRKIVLLFQLYLFKFQLNLCIYETT